MRPGAHMKFRILTRAVAAMVVVLTLVGASGCDSSQMANGSMILANREREARGIGRLRWDSQLAAKATRWAQHMADANTLSHSVITDEVSAGWSSLGENVGWGDDVEIVHQQFMASATHRDTMLKGTYSAVGIGVAVDGDKVWVAQVFKG